MINKYRWLGLLCIVTSTSIAYSSFSHRLMEVVSDAMVENQMDVQSSLMRLPQLYFPTFTQHKVSSHYAHHMDQIDIRYQDIRILPILRNAQDQDPANDQLRFQLRSGKAQKTLLSTLCTGDDRCSASLFTLTYHLRTRFITVSPAVSGPGLLKYNFETEQEEPFTDQDVDALNCILRNELSRPQSYLWKFEYIHPYDRPQQTQQVDGVTGATSLNVSNNLECQPPDGGLWTTLTVFAHAYEFQNQMQGQNIDDWAAILPVPTQQKIIDRWTLSIFEVDK